MSSLATAALALFLAFNAEAETPEAPAPVEVASTAFEMKVCHKYTLVTVRNPIGVPVLVAHITLPCYE